MCYASFVFFVGESVNLMFYVFSNHLIIAYLLII